MQPLFVLLALPLFAGCLADSPEIAQNGSTPFSTAPGQDAVFDLVVDDTGVVKVTIWIHNGASHGLKIYGPGDCDHKDGPWATVVSASGTGGAYATKNCGELTPGTYELRLSGGVIVQGSLESKGATLQSSAS